MSHKFEIHIFNVTLPIICQYQCRGSTGTQLFIKKFPLFHYLLMHQNVYWSYCWHQIIQVCILLSWKVHSLKLYSIHMAFQFQSNPEPTMNIFLSNTLFTCYFHIVSITHSFFYWNHKDGDLWDKVYSTFILGMADCNVFWCCFTP